MFTTETATADFTLFRSGLAVVVEKPVTRHDDETVDTDLSTFEAFTGRQRVAVVWDVRRMQRPTPQGLAGFLNRIPAVASGVAVLVDEESRSVVEAIPPVMSSLHFPMRVFDDYDEAHEWVEQFAPTDLSVDHLDPSN